MLALEIDFKNVVLVTSNGQKISVFINRATIFPTITNVKRLKGALGEGVQSVSLSHSESASPHQLKTCAQGNRGSISTTVKVEQKHTMKPVLLRTVSV